MAFEPFGYRFEVGSPMRPAGVKDAIRSRSAAWFEVKDGARGWVVGPYLCLWFSAFDRYGPMLFGRISADGLGTRITGRAGSDLNGLAIFTAMLLVTALLLGRMVANGDQDPGELVVGIGLLLLSPLVFWWSHSERRTAEPLVRFLRDAVTDAGRTLWAKAKSDQIFEGFMLDIGDGAPTRPVTAADIHFALLRAGQGDFVILEQDPETYVQAASNDGAFIIEQRGGSRDRHFHAMRRGVVPAAMGASASTFTFEEVRETFLAYATGVQTPHFLQWEPMLPTG